MVRPIKRVFKKADGSYWVRRSWGNDCTLAYFIALYKKCRLKLYESSIRSLGHLQLSAGEVRDVRLDIAFVPEGLTKEQRNIDIKWLFRKDKCEIARMKLFAKKYGISLSQLFRIIKAPAKKGRKRVVKTKTFSKPIPTDPILRAYTKRYYGISNVKSGNREFSNRYRIDPRVKIVQSRSDDFADSTARLFEHTPDRLKSFDLLRNAFTENIHAPDIDKLLSQKLSLPRGQVIAIRTFNIWRCPQYLSLKEEQEDMQRMVEQYFAYRTFLQKKGRFQKVTKTHRDVLSLTQVAQAFNISLSQLYRRIDLARLKKESASNPPRTYMVLCLDNEWFDIDTFTQPLPPQIKNLHFGHLTR